MPSIRIHQFNQHLDEKMYTGEKNDSKLMNRNSHAKESQTAKPMHYYLWGKKSKSKQ